VGLVFTNKFMVEAITLAKAAYSMDEVPVGAVIVKNNTIVASAHNLVKKLKDPTAHAELLAIRKAALEIGSEFLIDTQIYVTLEPCPMCAQAIAFARIKKLIYAAADIKGGGVENGPKIFHSSSCHSKPEVISSIMEEEASKLLKSFFINKRL